MGCRQSSSIKPIYISDPYIAFYDNNYPLFKAIVTHYNAQQLFQVFTNIAKHKTHPHINRDTIVKYLKTVCNAHAFNPLVTNFGNVRIFEFAIEQHLFEVALHILQLPPVLVYRDSYDYVKYTVLDFSTVDGQHILDYLIDEISYCTKHSKTYNNGMKLVWAMLTSCYCSTRNLKHPYLRGLVQNAKKRTVIIQQTSQRTITSSMYNTPNSALSTYTPNTYNIGTHVSKNKSPVSNFDFSPNHFLG